MDLIRFSISKPVTVAVGVILLLMFGLIGLRSIPVQLTPTVDRPIVTVTTSWAGRSPQEVVDAITREQEKRLKNVANLKRMRSNTGEGSAEVTLEFYIGSDVSRALQEVSDALRQVPAYPDEVDEPTIKAAEGASENAIAWIIIDLDPAAAERHPGFDITTLYDALDKEVRPFLERIDGVAEVNIYGGREREVRVLLDPVKLAQRSLNHLEVIAALRAANRNESAGTVSEGKRDYRVRVVGQFVNADDVLETIVAYREGRPVYVRDVGAVEFGHQKQRGFVRSLGNQCLAMNCIRQSNANVVDVMEDLRARLDEVRRDILPKLSGTDGVVLGADLRMRQVYDETVYIDSAIDLVTENLWQGGLLAAIVLLIFLRSLATTGLLAITIPLSVIGTFLVMLALGRTLNVVSLAGIAFSIGMGIDNAIVVLENITRRRQLGDSAAEAAYRGAREVWGAILASTLTNVAVFLPIITLQEESGQLFRDICIAATASVFISLIVAVTVIPPVLARMRDHSHDKKGRLRTAWEDLFGLASLAAWAIARFAKAMYWLMTGWRAHTLRPGIVIAMTALSLIGAWLLVPPLDYLPTGNRNLVFGGLLIPPGYSLAQQESIARRIEQQIGPYVGADAADPAVRDKLPKIFRFDDPKNPFEPVGIQNFFIGAFGGSMFCGATSTQEQVVIPVGAVVTNAMNTIPDAYGGARQTSIFGSIRGGGNSVNVEISGPYLDRVASAASMLFGLAGQKYTFRNVSPDPSNYNLSQPEWELRLNQRGRELGLTTRDVGVAIRGLVDGAFVDDFRLAGDTVDLVVLPAAGELVEKERLASVPVATPLGRTVPLDSIVEVKEKRAPQSILRVEELPAVSIRISPPVGVTVDELMATIRDDFLPKLNGAGLVDASMRVRLEGTAASLDEVRYELFGRPAPAGPWSMWRQALLYGAGGLALVGVLAGLAAMMRPIRKREEGHTVHRTASRLYAALGVLVVGLVIAGMAGSVAWRPDFLTARFIWALLVTYLLMCALYESFAYPLVIMFSVPLAIVGGFAALAIVHKVTLQNPTIAPQQLDVLTMLGFIIVIGIVVNNAILLVEQALNLMEPWRIGEAGAREKPMPALHAISESIRTRTRPIFMSALTAVFGTLPLVIMPGAGSEMYRGMGAVIIGGQLVSTIFTLVLVPLVFSLAIDMQSGIRTFVIRSTRKHPEAERHTAGLVAAGIGIQTAHEQALDGPGRNGVSGVHAPHTSHGS